MNLLEFILQQPNPIYTSQLYKLFWRDFNASQTRLNDRLIRLANDKYIARRIIIHGDGTLAIIVASPNIMERFTLNHDKPLVSLTPKQKLINYIQSNITNPDRDKLIAYINTILP